jgi:beta-barrel assembly-enhancing protease
MKTISAFAFVMLLAAVLHYPVHAETPGPDFRQRTSPADDLAAGDVAEEVRFGREVAARIVARFELYDNAKIMKYVNLVGHALSQSTNRPELEFHFAVLKTDEINAFAAPGGYIFVTRGALLKMKDESELAGVLAHELGHVIEKHAVKELGIKASDSSASAGLAAAIGGTSQSARTAFEQAVDKAMDLLFKDGYKREDEIQADKDAAMFCALSGYDPSGLARYFERIDAVKGKNMELLDKTHPAFADRIVWLKDVIAQEGLDTGNNRSYKERFTEMSRPLKAK